EEPPSLRAGILGAGAVHTAQPDRTCRSVDELVALHVQCRRARGWWRLLDGDGGPVLARGERTDRQHGIEPRMHATNANAGAYLAAGRRLSIFRAREVTPGSSVGRAADLKSACRQFDSAPGHLPVKPL